MRARALEVLDNTLMGSLRRDVACVIDDAPAEDKLRNADHLYKISCDEPAETLRRLVSAGDPGRDQSPVLTSAAIYTVATDRMTGLNELVRRQGERADSELVRETAMWAMARLDDHQGRDTMADMARIEKMAFLQGIDVFAECEAEEVLRTATIADERRVPAGEIIFQRDDPPDAMYCVVDGRIRLEVDGQESAVIGSGGRFGVVDILSGRPRHRTAIADAPSHLLVIEAEDFFDLLAGNVGIVRALFRQVLRNDGPGACNSGP
jgi:hypothetical protein